MIIILAKVIDLAAGIFELLDFILAVVIVLMFADLEQLGRDCSAWE